VVNLLVVYECGVKEIDGFKEPDTPRHNYKWRINEIKTKYTETGEVKECFIVKTEMEDTEFEKIKDSVKVIKVIQL